jgi:hypothetical protein
MGPARWARRARWAPAFPERGHPLGGSIADVTPMWRRRRRRRAVAIVVACHALSAMACIEAVNVGGNPLDAGTDVAVHDSGPRRESSVDCGDGSRIRMGVCAPVPPTCSTTDLDGSCPDGMSCEMGQCRTALAMCSVSSPHGVCPSGRTCEMGTCVPPTSCSPMLPDGGGCPDGQLCTPLGDCQTNPCVMSPCMGLLCCPTLSMGSYVAKCSMGMVCP